MSARSKLPLWIVLGAMTISVTLYSEVPLLLMATEQAHLRSLAWIFIPHALCGVVALISGPPQFSSRLRQRSPKLHRVLGRVYVGAVFVAAALGIVLSTYNHAPQAALFVVANSVQGGTWMMATAAAFLTARNRHMVKHREWMIRSYALTFTFISSRVLRPVPAWNYVGRAGSAILIILVTFVSVLVPDIAMSWREITHRRD